MKKALMVVSVLIIAVISTACINSMAVQELNNKADEYMQKGDYESAMSRLQASLDLDDTIYQTHYNLGIAALKSEKYEKAIEAFESGIKIKPDFADFYYSLAITQNELRNKALEDKENKTIDTDDLKIKVIDNLNKYLELTTDNSEKETVLELIKELDSENTQKVEG